MTHPEIEAFLAICEYKTISKAAEVLFVSQSSLSERIKTLESKAGCTLFHRGKGIRETSLTTEGKRFLRLALQYKEIYDQMLAVGQTDQTEQLRVSSFNSVGGYLLPLVYENFTQAYPQIQLIAQDISTEQACHNLEHNETDLSFTTEHINTEQLMTMSMLSEPMVFVCPKTAPYPETVSLDMLEAKNEVYLKWSNAYMRWLESAFGIDVKQYACIAMADQFRYFTHNSNCWAIVPQSVAKGLTGFPNIRQCQLQFYVPNRILYILMNRNSINNVVVESFLDELKKTLQELQVGDLLL